MRVPITAKMPTCMCRIMSVVSMCWVSGGGLRCVRFMLGVCFLFVCFPGFASQRDTLFSVAVLCHRTISIFPRKFFRSLPKLRSARRCRLAGLGVAQQSISKNSANRHQQAGRKTRNKTTIFILYILSWKGTRITH